MRSGSYHRFTLLTALYLAQGLPYGFFTQALPALLRELHISLPMIGVSYLLTLPWSLKFLWAPFADHYGFKKLGLRRSWILPLQAAAMLVLAILAFFPPEKALLPCLIGFSILNFCAATQDVATDALAVDMLSYRERGIAGGIQVAGYRLGMIIGGMVMLLVYEYYDWIFTMWGLAFFIALTTLPVLAYREPPFQAPITRPRFRETIALATRSGARPWIIVLVLYKTAHAFATGMLRPFLVDQGFTLGDIAVLLGGAGFTAGLVGAMVGGVIVGRSRDRKRPLIAFAILQVASVALYPLLTLDWSTSLPGFAKSTTGIGWGAYAICSIEHFTSGLSTCALFTLMMDACKPKTVAADYTFQASLVVIATGLAQALSGTSADLLGYNRHFLIAGILGLLFAGAVTYLVRRPEVRDFFSARAEDDLPAEAAALSRAQQQ